MINILIVDDEQRKIYFVTEYKNIKNCFNRINKALTDKKYTFTIRQTDKNLKDLCKFLDTRK